MQVAGTDQLGRLNLRPQPEIYPLIIRPDHPPQVHVDTLAGSFRCWRGDVFAGTSRCVLQAKEEALKLGQHGLHAVDGSCLTNQKGLFQTGVAGIKPG